MSIGLIGKKLGMTRFFDEDGVSIPVTVIDVSDNIFLQKRTEENDGYTAVQVAFDDQKDSRLNMSKLGHAKAHGGKAKRVIKEFRLEEGEELPEIDHPGMSLFEEGQFVDVIGTTKGKGFQGVMKRYNFHGQPAAHGHMMHRRTGGIGAGTDPGRVWKNKAMPGRHGSYRKTVQNLKVIKLRDEDNVILISGAIPGAKGGYVVIRPAVKKALAPQDLSKSAAPAKEASSDEAASE